MRQRFLPTNRSPWFAHRGELPERPRRARPIKDQTAGNGHWWLEVGADQGDMILVPVQWWEPDDCTRTVAPREYTREELLADAATAAAVAGITIEDAEHLPWRVAVHPRADGQI